MEHLLEIKDLKVEFPSKAGNIHAVNGVNMYVDKGEILGVVGESGCGKSVTLSNILGLVEAPPAIISGEITFNGENILYKNDNEFRKIRGKEIAMIFQDPMNCLDPVIRIGKQIMEMILEHEKMDKKQAYEEAVNLLKVVGIPDPEIRMNSYPHQLSGGMCQRVMIAIALACKPKLLLADEPTTALDVTIQAQILGLLRDIRDRFGTSIIIVTHDLGVVATLAQRIAVFYGGKVVEEADTREIFKNPTHPYTRGLIACVPSLAAGDEDLNVIEGNVPDLSNMPAGCPFHPRCQFATEECKSGEMDRFKVSEGHYSYCLLCAQ
ncbi:ABC transporter ATP-binding protein [Clostridium transplantifaecale]|uniref:ABC transporter ATP-binding protein n=1 Tax=Clostridium transplantifaecale TaxID=2479838 RepID=UPI000F632BC0|nr:ABC transporter ATP-binding protein [Clostridium transplantifaecale]